MTKSELIEAVAGSMEGTGMNKKLARATVEKVFELIKNTLAKGNKVQLIPFGIFEVKTRRAREGRNPRTGQRLSINARKVPVFRPGKGLRDAVARG